MQTGVYSAELGRELGQVSVTTKAGTNVFHGSVFRFRPERRVRCPSVCVCRGRVEVEFVQMESVRVHVGQSGAALADVQRQGQAVFHDQLRGIPPPQPERDALQRAVGRHAKRRFLPGQSCAQRSRPDAPFPGNIIPKGRIDPISLTLLDYYPAPNQPDSSLVNNYLAVNQNETNKNQINIRIDYGKPEVELVRPIRLDGRVEVHRRNPSERLERRHQCSSGRRGQRARADQHARQRSALRVQQLLQSRRRRAQQRLQSHRQIGLKFRRPFLPMPGARRALPSPDFRGSATIPSHRSSIATPTFKSSTTSRGRAAGTF